MACQYFKSVELGFIGISLENPFMQGGMLTIQESDGSEFAAINERNLGSIVVC